MAHDPLESIREQIKEDFKSTMTAMAAQREAITVALQKQEGAIGDLALRIDQRVGVVIAEMQALQQRSNERFEKMELRLSEVERRLAG